LRGEGKKVKERGRGGEEEGRGGERIEGKGGGKESRNTPSINSCLRPWFLINSVRMVLSNQFFSLDIMQ